MTDGPRRPLYENPPLIEAILAFTFARSSVPWDVVFFGKFHDKIESTFPVVEVVNQAQVTLNPQERNIAFSTTEAVAKRFARKDGGMVVTVGPTALGVSVLHQKIEGGHPGWEVLRNTALELLATYQAITKPDGVSQVGVRYINALPIVPGDFRLSNVLTPESGMLPPVLEEETQPFSYVIARFRESAEEYYHTETVRLSAGLAQTNQEGRLVLDVDEIFIVKPGRVLTNDYGAVGDMLHDAVYDLFERAVRPDVRAAFGPRPQRRSIG